MCPTDQSIQRLSIITLVFICQSMKQTYRSSKYVHFTTNQWILKWKSVNYDLNTVCPRKKVNSRQHQIFRFFEWFWWKTGEIWYQYIIKSMKKWNVIRETNKDRKSLKFRFLKSKLQIYSICFYLWFYSSLRD